jgi:hypothetical protein
MSYIVFRTFSERRNHAIFMVIQDNGISNDCSTVDLLRNDSVLAVDGALLAKLVPTTETTNVDLTRDGEICRMNQVDFGAAVGI